MGLFDHWRRRAAPASPLPVASPAATPVAIVPDGHQLGMYRTGPLPAIVSSAGGVWLAHVGSSSDEREIELDTILAGVGELMRGPRPRAFLSNMSGPLSSLMAPNDPEVIPHDGMLVWTVDAAGLAGAPRAASLIQRWLRCIYTIGTRGAPPLQSVFLHEVVSPHARAVAALVRGLGLGVRVPDAGEAAVLAEVHRPEGVILSAILGTPQDPADPADASAHQVNKAKDRAEEDGDIEQQQRLEAEERDALEKKLAPAGDGPRVSAVQRAPRLRRLLLAVADGGDLALSALHEELLRREVPLQVIVDPKTAAAQLHDWPGVVEALPVYGDEITLLTSARDHGMKLGTFAAAVMPPPKLFEWAASHSWAIAMNAFRAPDQPVYLVLTADDVKALARGSMPTKPDRTSTDRG